MKNYKRTKVHNKNQDIYCKSGICYSSSQQSYDTTLQSSASVSNYKITLKSNHKLLNQNQVEYYIRLLKEAELSIFSRDALIDLLRQQFDYIDNLYQISLSNIEDITHKYKLTKKELDCLKNTCEKYTYDVEILIREKNETRLKNSEKQYSKWLQQFQKMRKGSSKETTSKIPKPRSDNSFKKNNLQETSQQSKKQSGNNNAQYTSINEENMNAIDVEKLLKENEILKQELNEIKLEHERLLNFDNSRTTSKETIEIHNLLDKVETLKRKVNNLYERNLQINRENEEEVEIFRNDKITREDSLESELRLMNISPSFLEVKDSLTNTLEHNEQEIETFNPTTDFADLQKENVHLQELILALQQNQHNDDEIDKLTHEIVNLKKLLKQKTEELHNISHDVANLNQEDDVIRELREKQVLFQKDYKETVDKNNTLSDQLSQQSGKVNEKMALISNLQEEMKLLNTEFEQKQLMKQRSKLNEELNETLQALQQSLQSSEDENKGYNKELAKHDNCQQLIDGLNAELAEKTILIAKLKSDFNKGRQAKFNKEQIEYKNKINALNNENAELQNIMDKKHEEINNLESLNKELTEKLNISQTHYAKDLKYHNRSIDEISYLLKSKEEEVLKTKNSVKSKEENLEKLKTENDELRKLLEQQESSLKTENMILEENILEQQRKSINLENLTQYASKINDLEQLNEEYMNTIKAFTNLCNLLNSKNEEVVEVKSILNVLIENMESSLSNYSNNNELKINTAQIDNMIASIRKFYKSDLNAQNISKSNLNLDARNYTPISNQVIKFSKSDQFYRTNNVKDLLMERECLHQNLNSVNEKLQLVLHKPIESSLCNCGEINVRRNFCFDNIEIIPNKCWIQSVDLLKQMAADLSQIKQYLLPQNYESSQSKNSNIPKQTQITCKSLQTYVVSMKKLLEKAVNILDEIGKIEKSL